MVCPHCGDDTPAPGGRCSSCNGTVTHPSAVTVAAATMTPPPDGAATIAGPAPGTSPGPTGPGRTGFPQTSQGPLEPGAPFGARYRILRELGAGGMGVVYQAWDDELGVAVALKVIRPEVVADPYAARDVERRFKRELLLARQVTHKHVVRIHDLGEVDGIKYLTMPYIEGRDLASLLRESGVLPVARALRLARQIAAGLQAAHEAGVVHRDLKPENIMIDGDEQASIMDFGISRSVSGGGNTMTARGAVVGTLEYMAPEQARGQQVDHRADIYAFGLMLRDMLVGRTRLDSSDSAIAEMMARMTDSPPSMRQLQPGISAELDAIVARAVQTDPDKRYQSTAELAAALEALDVEGQPLKPSRPAARGTPRLLWAAVGVAVLALGAVVVMLLRDRGTGAPPAAAREPITVLIADFQNKTGDEVFEGSVEQALGIGLEGASFLTAYPRRDALRTAAQIAPNNTRLDEQVAPLVARRDGINVVLAGLIEPSGGGYRISVRAIDPATQQTTVTEEVQASTKPDVLQAVGTLAAKIRRSLGDTPVDSPEVARRETFTAGSLEAAREYSLGQELSNAGRDEDAIQRYERAIQLDPNFGRAYSGLASLQARLGRTDAATRNFDTAISLADRMTEREKLRTLGLYYIQIKRDHEAGIKTYSDLVSRYPNDGAAHNNLAVAYLITRQFKKALDQGRQVVEVYPRSVVYRYNYALYAMYAGEFETADREAKRALELNAQTPSAYLAIAMAALAGGRTADARTAYQRAKETGPRGVSLAAIGLADVAMFEGKYQEAVPILEEGIRVDEAAQNVLGAATKKLALAEALLVLGRKDDALQAVQSALKAPHAPAVAVPAADVLIALGRDAEATGLARELGKRFSVHEQAAALLIEGRLSLARGRATEAVRILRDAAAREDHWLVRLALGAAYLTANEPQLALPELEACEARIGEATSVFLDDIPTFRYRVPLKYWKGRAQLALKQASAEQTLKDFLAHRPPGSNDPLAADARRLLERR